MCLLPRGSIPTQAQIATCTRDVAHVFCVPKAESSIVLMRTDDKTRGPAATRTPVSSAYLTHAEISVVNAWMISPHIRFKAIYRLSVAFSTFSWVADPLED